MKAESVMTKSPMTCAPSATVHEAARTMGEQDCGVLPVVDEGRLVGIVTDRDLAVRALGRGGGATVRDCMTHDVFVARTDTSVEDCIATMEQHKVRRLPIVDAKGALQGIVSLDGLAMVVPPKRTGEALMEIASAQRPPTALLPHVPKEDQRGAERYVYGEITPPFGSPQDLPREITDGMPMNVIDLYYDSFHRAYKELQKESKKSKVPEDVEKAAETVAWAAVRQKYVKSGGTWVPKRG